MSRFTITATLKEVYELTYSSYTDADEKAVERTESFASPEEAKEFISTKHVYVISFVKVTDCMDLVK